jgi:hypothetical protein
MEQHRNCLPKSKRLPEGVGVLREGFINQNQSQRQGLHRCGPLKLQLIPSLLKNGLPPKFALMCLAFLPSLSFNLEIIASTHKESINSIEQYQTPTSTKTKMSNFSSMFLDLSLFYLS